MLKKVYRKSYINFQFKKAKEKNRISFLNLGGSKGKVFTRIPLVLGFHPALSGVGKII